MHIFRSASASCCSKPSKVMDPSKPEDHPIPTAPAPPTGKYPVENPIPKEEKESNTNKKEECTIM